MIDTATGIFHTQFPKHSAVDIYKLGKITPHWLQLIIILCNYWQRFTALHAAQFNSSIFNAFTHYWTGRHSPLRKLICTNWYVQTDMYKLICRKLICTNWYVQTDMYKLICTKLICTELLHSNKVKDTSLTEICH